jgi:hypothetical protein
MTSPAAQEVLRELTRRRRRRRVLGLAVVAALIAAAILYLRFGGGFGFGGESARGESAGTGSAGSAAGSAAPRCAIKVTAAGLVVNGAPPTRDVAAVVATCKAGSGVVMTVVGDAREGDFAELKRALEAAGVAVEQRVR